MAYTPQTWADDPDHTTPISANRLRNIENGIQAASATADTAASVGGALNTALNTKAPVNSPAFTGNPTTPTPPAGDNDTSIANTAFVANAVAGVIAGTGGVSSVASKTGAVTLNKNDVGLGNVDNTSDANKPISNATQTALSGLSGRVTTLESSGGGGGGSAQTVARIGSVITDVSNGVAGATQTLTVTCPVGVVAGNLLIAAGADQTATSTVAAPSGWTQLDTGSLSGNPVATIYYRYATSADTGGSTTYTFTFGAGRASLAIVAYANATIDAHNVSLISTATTSLPLPATTTTATTTELVGFIFAKTAATGATPTVTPPSGWTEQAEFTSNSPSTNNLVMQVITKTATVSGAQAGTSTITSSATAICFHVAIKTAAVVSGGSSTAPFAVQNTWATGTLAIGVNTVDASDAAKSPTLPTPTQPGQLLSVEKTDSSANTVTVSGMIRGVTSSIALTSQYQTIVFEAESFTSWRPFADHRTKAALDAAYFNVLGTPSNPVTNAAAARPAGLTVVYWETATPPTNMADRDYWTSTA